LLTLNQKREILNSFEELREHKDKFDRYFYYFDNSPSRKKIVAREFVSSGNGYVYGLLIPEYRELLYKDGSVCVKEFSAQELWKITRKSIDSLKSS
jgi:hypothetical protein